MGDVYDRMAPGPIHDYFPPVSPFDLLPKQPIK
mgnify:CR=1 FL=1